MASSEAVGKTPPAAVLCELDCELVHLRATLPPARENWLGRRHAWLTSLEEWPIVLGVCGVGMVSAAAVTEAIVSRYAPAAVINY